MSDVYQSSFFLQAPLQVGEEKKSQAHIMLHVREITTQQHIKGSYSEREGHEKLREVLITSCLSGEG